MHTFTVHDGDDLAAFWRFVDGEHGYSVDQLFAVVIEGDGTASPVVVQVCDDHPEQEPDDELITNLVWCLEQASDDPDMSIAVMRARPGRAALTQRDSRWCRALHRALVDSPTRTWPLWFATPESVGPVPADVLIDAA